VPERLVEPDEGDDAEKSPENAKPRTDEKRSTRLVDILDPVERALSGFRDQDLDTAARHERDTDGKGNDHSDRAGGTDGRQDGRTCGYLARARSAIMSRGAQRVNKTARDPIRLRRPLGAHTRRPPSARARNCPRFFRSRRLWPSHLRRKTKWLVGGVVSQV
jgi:hypothetical protein